MRAPRPSSTLYPKQINTLGDHIRKRRVDLGLTQKQTAERIGVTVCTITNWEGQHSHPALPHVPAIIRFLGYNPLPEADTLAGRLTRYRFLRGISQEALAKMLGIDESTLARWERGDRAPIGLYRRVVETLLNEDVRDY